MFDFLMNPFENLATEHQRFSALKNSKYYVKPEPYLIGTRREMLKGKLQNVDVVGQHVPLAKTLQKFFEIPNALKDTLDYMAYIRKNDSVFSNFIQGSLWSKKTSGL